MNAVAIGFIIALKFAVPIAIVFVPFAGGWANFVLDTIDGDLLIPLGLDDATYQPIDKIADWFTYVGMAVAAWRFRWPIRKWVYALFAMRTAGQLTFFITGDERVFFYFPNLLEPLFLVYATIVAFKKDLAPEVYRAHRWPIWIGVVVYKMQDEWITHIGNFDRSEWIRGLFG